MKRYTLKKKKDDDSEKIKTYRTKQEREDSAYYIHLYNKRIREQYLGEVK